MKIIQAIIASLAVGILSGTLSLAQENDIDRGADKPHEVLIYEESSGRSGYMVTKAVRVSDAKMIERLSAMFPGCYGEPKNPLPPHAYEAGHRIVFFLSKHRYVYLTVGAGGELWSCSNAQGDFRVQGDFKALLKEIHDLAAKKSD